MGRGIESGQQENREAEERTKAQAAAADKKIDSTLKTAEQMTPATVIDGVEAAEREAEDDIRHAGADPKGTFNRALAQIRQGVENTAAAVKEGVQNTAHRVKQGVQDTAKDVYVWSKEPAVEEAEDLLKLGGRKAATAPREVTINVATGVATGVAGKLVGGAVLDGIAESKAAQKLLEEAEKKAEHSPYGHLPPPRTVAPGKKPSAVQKERMRAANMKANEGKLIDDYTGQELVPPAKSRKGVVPPPNEAQVDHRIPASRGGDNSYDNLRLTSRQHNRSKSNRMPNDNER